MKPEDLKMGDLIQHFKRETIEDETSGDYLYQYIGIAQHTETGKKLVVYRALYGDFNIYTRPYDMFFSKVDKEKYPDIKQEYRLEKFESIPHIKKYGEYVESSHFDAFIEITKQLEEYHSCQLKFNYDDENDIDTRHLWHSRAGKCVCGEEHEIYFDHGILKGIELIDVKPIKKLIFPTGRNEMKYRCHSCGYTMSRIE